MRIPGGKKTGSRKPSEQRLRDQKCREQLSKAGESGRDLLLIPVHLRARKARGLPGVSNKWLYCVCPAGVQARAGVMGTAPDFRGRKGDLASVAWPGASVLCRQTWGHLPPSSSMTVSTIFSRQAGPQVRAHCVGDTGRGSDVDSREC